MPQAIRKSHSLKRTGAALLLAAGFAFGGTARADDTDIYTNTSILPLQAPLTALALDLNLTDPNAVVCDNVLLSSSQACVDIRGRVTVGELLSLLGLPITIVGGLNPAALLSDLGGSLTTVLAGVVGLTNSLALSNQQAFVLAVQQILSSLVDSRVTILLNHANKGPGTGVCAFADLASLPGPRQDTLACSNGAYLFKGLTNLADPVQLLALVTRIVSGVSAASVQGLLTGLPTLSGTPYQAKEIYAELVKYLRGDAIFNGHLGYFDYGDTNQTNNLDASLPLLSWDTSVETNGGTRYQSGLAAFPQACNINLLHVQLTQAAQQDESDADLRQLFPDVAGSASSPIALSDLVATAATEGFVFGAGDRRLISSNFIVQENLFTNGDLSELDKIGNLGGNVTSYSGILGLLGRGQDIASSLIKTLAVDTTFGSITTAASRSTASGITDAAYLPLFRPEKNQKPAWLGNVKRLRLRASGSPVTPPTLVDVRDNPAAAAVNAIAPDGRIRTSALTVWTDATQLGAGVAADGRKTDLGGAGQRIPGYAFEGGGTPGRGGTGSARRMFFDSRMGVQGAHLKLLNADDADVRTELLAATGATSLTLADPNAAANAQAARDTRDAACNAAGAFTSQCAAENATCTANCNGGDYNTVCNNEQASCNSGCTASCTATFPGALNTLLRNTCISVTCPTTCAATRLTCPVTKIAQCNLLCPIALALCPATRQAQCLADSAAQYTSDLLAGTVTRTADTVTRELLLHARGYDVGTSASPKGNGPANSRTNSGVFSRAWMMGAVLHSKPLAINYGRRNGAQTEDVRVVFGSADGVMHMLDDASGVENWGFMPQAVMGSLRTLRDNEPGAALPYGVDGSPVVLIRDRTGNDANSRGDGVISADSSPHDRVLLFFGLRRGGGQYYALDITDPDNPTLQWQLSSQGLRRGGETAVVANSAADFAALALAFSTPQVGRVRIDADGQIAANNDDADPRSVLIFGGGYHGGRTGAGTRIGKDLNNSQALTPALQVGQNDGAGTADRGNAVFMVDAVEGTLLWRAVRGAAAAYTAATRSYAHPLLVDSIASDLTVLDTDNDGLTDRLYVGDTGGRLWRGDFAGALSANWTFGPIASVGRQNAGAGNLANDRRIFFAPDYVPLRGIAGSGRDIVLFGTGDREDPLNLVTENWYYGFIDPDLVSGKPANEVITTEAALPSHTAFRDVTTAPLTNLDGLTPGYRRRLTGKGEKMFTTPVTLDGTVTFSTYIPPDPSDPANPICVPSEGVSRLYALGVQTTAVAQVNGATLSDADSKLAKPGLPGEINALGLNVQSVGSEVFTIRANDRYRASWRERLGESQK